MLKHRTKEGNLRAIEHNRSHGNYTFAESRTINGELKMHVKYFPEPLPESAEKMLKDDKYWKF